MSDTPKQIDTSVFCFLYSNGFFIKALGYDEAKKSESILLSQGFKHVATLESLVYIQWLLNDCADLEKEIEEYRKQAK